ncbi:Transcription initiation factor TFIID subunit 7 [Choanephora cucurbitarum]|uniref:Transcription initiation factor TFIID subunit 7 n=1 Tax=Choanephora cucurbitarum TaxID=101091 RepID=A0A1C7NFL2_9FUNG|nr:Transcription initiation factor TFIID subunit 7 [Choanephora cucurbitarum]
MEPSKDTPTPKIKVRRPRQPKSETSNRKDKTIKIKLTAKGGNHYDPDDRLVGSDEEDPEAAIEEQLVFRVPEGDMCNKLHEYVKKREIPQDIALHFRDNRKGYFVFDGKQYDAQIVDLPTIIESQKTYDSKQFYKVADISQMLLVDPASGSEPFIPHGNARLDTDPNSFPHGLTPPLKHVRQRRFRKKLSKRAIEEVEREVERLLEIDATAEDVQYEVVDNREFENEQESDAGTQDIDIDDSEDEIESDDEDLAAAIDREMDDDDDDDDDKEDDDEDEDEDESEEDEDEDDEGEAQTSEIEQKRQEIAEIKQAIQRKTRDLSTAPNAMLKARFETDINNLKKSLTLKEAHLAELNEKEKEK